jgi:hypothetical protein
MYDKRLPCARGRKGGQSGNLVISALRRRSSVAGIADVEEALGFVGEEFGGEHTGGQRSDIRRRREGQVQRTY